MSINNTCPKCGKKMSTFYLKQNCPDCGVDLLYYKLEERLEEDAKEAKRQQDAVDNFLSIIKRSTIASPILVVRLVLFFTPLASMCLPMYNGLTLINVIVGFIKGELEITSVFLPLFSMALVIVLSLAVIISSLFSATKKGLMRNLIFSLINTLVFVSFGMFICERGVGWYLTFAIYIAELVLHGICNKKINSMAEKDNNLL